MSRRPLSCVLVVVARISSSEPPQAEPRAARASRTRSTPRTCFIVKAMILRRRFRFNVGCGGVCLGRTGAGSAGDRLEAAYRPARRFLWLVAGDDRRRFLRDEVRAPQRDLLHED